MRFELEGNQKYRCSQCEITFIKVDDHYECNKKCKKDNNILGVMK